MLRLLTIGLLAANLLYFGWSLGWLDAIVGIRAQGDREPQRLSRQVNPERVILASEQASAPSAAASESASKGAVAQATTATATGKLSGQAAPAASTPAAGAEPTTTVCLEAGPFGPGELGAAESALRTAWQGGSWTKRRIAGNGEWMIYMGPYPDDAWIQRKKGELSRIRGGMPYEVVTEPPEFARGLSLGRFPSQAEAAKRLDQYRLRGIRTASVVKSGEGPGKVFLRVAKADTGVAARLAAIKWPAGRGAFSACPTTP